MEVSQDYSWPEMYSRCSWIPYLMWQELLSCLLLFVGFNSTFKGYKWWSICCQAWYLRMSTHSKCWRGAPFTWIGFPFYHHGNHLRHCLVEGFVLTRFDARKLVEDKTRSVYPLFFWRVPCVKLAAHVPKLNSYAPPGTLLPWLPTWMGWLYGTQLSTHLNPTSICVYLVDKHFHVLLPEV